MKKEKVDIKQKEIQNKLKENMADDKQKLPAGKKTKKIKGADELAIEAMSQASQSASAGDNKLSTEEETAKSDDFAETMHALEKLIESKARKLMLVKNKMKKKREMIKSVFENDVQLSEAEQQKEEIRKTWKERKTKLKETPEVQELKQAIGEMRDDQKDLEESLSNHLISYHQLTNSTSFDTSEGDQWEFKIKAKVKNRKI
ncbi:MAG: hypothetical protein U9O78_02510 [Patescibacteria group bacterium]|nr:hypothetical protein [Patescibacteria group bacterium]